MLSYLITGLLWLKDVLSVLMHLASPYILCVNLNVGFHICLPRQKMARFVKPLKPNYTKNTNHALTILNNSVFRQMSLLSEEFFQPNQCSNGNQKEDQVSLAFGWISR